MPADPSSLWKPVQEDTSDWKSVPEDWSIWRPVEEKSGQQPSQAAPKEEPYGGLKEFITSPHGLLRTGASQIGQGLKELFTSGQRERGAADAIEGAGRFAAPFALPFAVEAPIAALAATGGGLVGQKLGESAAEHFGAKPETTRLIGDLAALPGALVGAKGAKYAPEIGAAARGAANGAWRGATAPVSLRSPGRIAGGLIGHHFGGWTGALAGEELLPRVAPTLAGAYNGARQGLVDLNGARTVHSGLVNPGFRRLGPSESNMPGIPDTSGVRVTTGDPLSYPGPRQIAAPLPGPTQNLRPPARLGAGPIIAGPVPDTSGVRITTGDPLSYAGPRLLNAPGESPAGLVDLSHGTERASVHSGGFAAGPQIQFVPPSNNLASNPRALEAARQLQQELAKPGALGRALERAVPSNWTPGSEVPGWNARSNHPPRK